VDRTLIDGVLLSARANIFWGFGFLCLPLLVVKIGMPLMNAESLGS
jgi:hypothetical protein